MTKKTPDNNIELTDSEIKQLATPGFIVILVLAGFSLVHGLLPQASQLERWFSISFALAGAGYGFILYYWLYSVIYKNNTLKWLINIFSSLMIAIGVIFEPFMLHGIAVLITLTGVATLSILGGRWYTYCLALLAYVIPQFVINRMVLAMGLDAWFTFLTVPIIVVLITETMIKLQNNIYVQMTHLRSINRVAQSLGYSLEIDQVIALLSSAIQNALDADTYYVALLNNGKLRLELFYDDGEFFPPVEISTENSLAGWVVRNHAPLLIRDIITEAVRYDYKYTTIGQPRQSQSWMGTPLMTGGQVLGLVAVASYRKKAFDQRQFELLQNVAQQAAMAIDNANHHGEVEKQSMLDSLTGAYNHGHFLKVLEHEIDDALIFHTPVSLIMLDIDKFKIYNDSYGHMVGDHVLTSLTGIIRQHIKSTDAVGRWGGEEFGVILPRANPQQAHRVARRIQKTMSELMIEDRNGDPIPAPTVSQGIAVYPDEADSAMRLVDFADQRLYLAKERGRNTIEPVIETWISLDPSEPA